MSVSVENRAALGGSSWRSPRRRAEEGCIDYEIYENSRDSSRILILGTWRDAAALDAHQRTGHFRLRAPRNREFADTSVLGRYEF